MTTCASGPVVTRLPGGICWFSVTGWLPTRTLPLTDVTVPVANADAATSKPAARAMNFPTKQFGYMPSPVYMFYLSVERLLDRVACRVDAGCAFQPVEHHMIRDRCTFGPDFMRGPYQRNSHAFAGDDIDGYRPVPRDRLVDAGELRRAF